MPAQDSRFAAGAIVVAQGWTARHLTPPSRFYGANGLRTGPDGRIYVAQVAGSQVSAIDPDTGRIETISPFGGDIIGPDDLAFDDAGNLFVTEITENRVSMRSPDGTIRVLQGDLPVANPITFHQGRLIAGECRPGARIMELDRNGGAPRLILDDVPMANAFEVGPDGKLYFPVMGTNEIWRVDLEGGTPEVIAGDLGVPDSVKFDSRGFIVSTQVASGQVLRIDPQSGSRELLAQLEPGLDNCTFVGDRLFASNMTGSVHEITGPGKFRPLVSKGFQWPMGIAVDDSGTIFVADGAFCYAFRPGDEPGLLGMLFTPGYPGFSRGVASADEGAWIVTTANGEVKRYTPQTQTSEELGQNFDRLMGVAVASDGNLVVAEYGTGRLLALRNGEATTLADGLDEPTGVAVDANGVCYVAESAAGRIMKVAGSRSDVFLDGLGRPEGLAIRNDKLYFIDIEAKTLVECATTGSSRQTVASNLPVGAPLGRTRKYLGAVGVLSGPIVSFCGLAVSSDGALYLSADGDGSVMTIEPVAG